MNIVLPNGSICQGGVWVHPAPSQGWLMALTDAELVERIEHRLAERATEPDVGYYESCDYLQALNRERHRRAEMTAHARIAERRKVAMRRAAEAAGRRPELDREAA